MVSDAIVFCIGLLADVKYSNFRPLLDLYVENLFSSTNAYTIMLDSLLRNIERAAPFDNKQTDDRKSSLDLGSGRGDSQAQVEILIIFVRFDAWGLIKDKK